MSKAGNPKWRREALGGETYAITARLAESDVEKLDHMCEEQQATRSKTIRELIRKAKVRQR